VREGNGINANIGGKGASDAVLFHYEEDDEECLISSLLSAS
jgi:hypothetical protein